MSSVSPARRAAFSILETIEDRHGHSDELLRGRNVDKLSAADRNLTTALVLGALRWQIELDRQIQALLKHPNAKLDSKVLIALRLGAFQILHMDRIPARAAIDESVELTKQAGHRFASGMVNAVLRKLAASRTGVQADDKSGLLGSYPEWLFDRWAANFGEEVTYAICLYGQGQPNLSLRLDGTAETEAEIEAAGLTLGHGDFLAASRRVLAGDLTKAAALLEGRIRIQDEGSQLIAELVPRGQRILDCCAAPGGKTLILAERNADAHLVACETSHKRLGQLLQRLDPLGSRVEIRHADATKPVDDAAFDVALADVPCSGTGTLSRNPEIRHRLRPEDLLLQASRQRKILSSALHAVRPGGSVLYSTCSLETEENEQVIAAVLAEHADASLIPLQPRIEVLRSEGILTAGGARQLLATIADEGFLRLLPGVHGTDGFFAALLQRMH